ncbi:MAG: TolB family protein, partial [Longimicrobiales bacterium]
MARPHSLHRLLATFVLHVLTAGALSAQEPADTADAPAREQWDVTQARGETRTIAFTTDEGTSLSIDVSPDGRSVVFDLLGHIWRVPADGGTAESLTQNSGVALNYQPTISPEGRHIAFISDRAGQNNLWI